jgi:hypothetical protein
VAVAVAVAVVAVAVAVDSWMSLSNRWHQWFFVNVAHPKLTLKRFLRVFSRQTNHWHAKIDCFFTSKSIVFLDKIYHVQGSVGTIFVNGSAPAQTATGTVEIGKEMFTEDFFFCLFVFSILSALVVLVCVLHPYIHALTSILLLFPYPTWPCGSESALISVDFLRIQPLRASRCGSAARRPSRWANFLGRERIVKERK